MPYSKEHKNHSKTRILQSAGKLFSRYGFDKVSITEIMRLARMTHGAFYAHFESKEALFSASISDAFKQNRFSRLGKGPFSINQLTGMVADYWILKTLKDQSEPGPAAILINEINNERPEIRRLYEASYERMKRLLKRRITALSKLRIIPAITEGSGVEEKCRAILATLVGAISLARNIPSEEERIQIIRAAQKQILNMLGLKESEFVLL